MWPSSALRLLDVGPKHEAGAVYVFVRSTDGRWTPQARLTALDGVAQDYFGRAVDVSGDTILVGAPYHDVAGKDGAGAVYVFKRSGGSWVQQDKLIAADASARAGFGAALAIDGDTLVVGSPWHDRPGRLEAGAAYVFTRSGDTWRQQAELLAADGAAADYLGDSVDIQQDLALVGAPSRDYGLRVDAGGAYMFERSGTVWTQQDVLVAVNGSEKSYFGHAVAVAGHTALVGAPAASARAPPKPAQSTCSGAPRWGPPETGPNRPSWSPGTRPPKRGSATRSRWTTRATIAASSR